MLVFRSRLMLLLTLTGFALAGGCSKPEQITHYTVDKPPALEAVAHNGQNPGDPHQGMLPSGAGAADPSGASGFSAANAPAGEPTDRTLGAIVPVQQQGWFFKLTGPQAAVGAKADEFSTFVKSVKFGADGKPSWTLPAGWQERPGSQIRFATLVLPGEGKPLEVSVTVLPNTTPDPVEYVLININRWRGQLSLPPITREQLASDTTQIPLAEGTATMVNLLGKATGGGMATPPFMSGGRNGN